MNFFKKTFSPLFTAFIVVLFVAIFGIVKAAPPLLNYSRTILPEQDSLYELGTSSAAWLRINTDILCLTADLCRTTWPTGGGGGGSNWQAFSSNPQILTPTTTGAGILINAATSTFTNLHVANLTASTTNITTLTLNTPLAYASGGTGATGFTSGEAVFATSGVLDGDPEFVWENASKFLALGGDTPGYRFDIWGNSGTLSGIRITNAQNSDTGTANMLFRKSRASSADIQTGDILMRLQAQGLNSGYDAAGYIDIIGTVGDPNIVAGTFRVTLSNTSGSEIAVITADTDKVAITGNHTVSGNSTTSGYLIVGTTQPTINMVAGDLLVGRATTTNLAVTGILNAGLLATNNLGTVVATTTYPGFAAQFDTRYNATTTQAGFQTQFNTALNATTTLDLNTLQVVQGATTTALAFSPTSMDTCTLKTAGGAVYCGSDLTGGSGSAIIWNTYLPQNVIAATNTAASFAVGGTDSSTADFYVDPTNSFATTTIVGYLRIATTTSSLATPILTIDNRGGIFSSIPWLNAKTLPNPLASPTGDDSLLFWDPLNGAFGAFVHTIATTTTDWGGGSATFGDTNVTRGYGGMTSGVGNYNAGASSLLTGEISEMTTQGSQSFAFGSNNYINNALSFAGGSACNVNGYASFCFGEDSSANGTESLAIGIQVRSTAQGSWTLGGDTSFGTILTNNKANSLYIGFKSNIPTFVITPASGLGTIGRVGIGTTTPDAVFHVTTTATIVGEKITGAVSQTANLFEIQDSTYVKLFTVSPTGNVTTTGYLVVGTTQPTINMIAGDLLAGRATTTNLAVSSLTAASCDVKAIASLGTLVCGTDANSGGGSVAWQALASDITVITPTTTGAGIYVNSASSTIQILRAPSLNSTTTGVDVLRVYTSANLSGASILNYFGTACSGNQWLQDIADNGAFSCGNLDVTGNWTGTLDGFNANALQPIIWNTITGGAKDFIVATNTVARFGLGTTTPGGTYGETLTVDGGAYFTRGVTTTNLSFATTSSMFTCDLKTSATGAVYCGTDAQGAGGSAAWQALLSNINEITPTTTNASIYVSGASSTIAILRAPVINSTTTNVDTLRVFTAANLSGASITNYFGTACSGNQWLQDIADNGAFSCSNLTTSGDWTGTLDGFNANQLQPIIWNTITGGVKDFIVATNTQALFGLATTTPGGTYGERLTVDGGAYFTRGVTTTNLSFATTSSMFTCDLKTSATGAVYCGTDADSGGGGSNMWNTYLVTGVHNIAPTNTAAALVIGAQATTTAPFAVDSTGRASSTALWVTGSATTTGVHSFDQIELSDDYLTDLNGTGLLVTSGVLNVSGLTVTEFASANVSQWTNDAAYLTRGAWHVFGSPTNNIITPTSSGASILVNSASSTITSLHSQSFTASTSNVTTETISSTLNLNGASVTNYYGTACANNNWLQDIADAGTFSCGALNVTGDWTGTLDNFNANQLILGHWQELGTPGTAITPTSTVGIVVNASSTVTRLTMNYGTSTNYFVVGTTNPQNNPATGDLLVGGSATTTVQLTVGSASTNGIILNVNGVEFFGTAKPFRIIILTAGGGSPTVGDTGTATTTQNTILFTNNRTTMVSMDFPSSTVPAGQVSNVARFPSAQWTTTMPDSYDGGTMAAKFMSTATTTTGNVSWCIQAFAWASTTPDATLIDSAFGTAQCLGGQIVTTANNMVYSTYTSQITIGGSPGAGSVVQWRVYRNPSQDNRANYGRLLMIELKYLTNRLSD